MAWGGAKSGTSFLLGALPSTPELPSLQGSAGSMGLPGEKPVLLASAVFGRRPVVKDHSGGGGVAWRGPAL